MSTMTKPMRKSLLNDQAKLKILCDDLCDHIEEVLDYFGLEYKTSNKMVSMSCPIHGGDNIGAISLYTHGDSYRGNWKCRTHNCEQVFKGSVLGFIRGILSHQKHNWIKSGDTTCSFQETIDFVTTFLRKDLKDIKISNSSRNKQRFSNIISNISNTSQKTESLVTREIIRKNLIIPATYFINRGFSVDILNKYDVGLCDKPNKEMSNRVVAPIYDNDYRFMVGCTGRSIFEKCIDCGSFHNQSDECPPEETLYLYSKWKHSANFKSQNHLYNYWFAKEHIKEQSTVIVVESPGNVWRLAEAGIHNSVAIFGSSLSDRQKMLLDASGAMSIIILTDNDNAGRQAALQIQQKCKNTYKIYTPTISKADIGEMSIQEINTEIKPILDNIL